MQKIWGFSVLAMVLCGQAMAAQWVSVGQTSEYKVYVDTDSIKHSGRYTQAWSRSELLSPIMVDNRKVLAAQDLANYDCANREGRQKQEILMGESGQAVPGKASLPHNAPINFWLVKAGEPAALAFSYICQAHRQSGSGD